MIRLDFDEDGLVELDKFAKAHIDRFVENRYGVVTLELQGPRLISYTSASIAKGLVILVVMKKKAKSKEIRLTTLTPFFGKGQPAFRFYLEKLNEYAAEAELSIREEDDV